MKPTIAELIIVYVTVLVERIKTGNYRMMFSMARWAVEDWERKYKR